MYERTCYTIKILKSDKNNNFPPNPIYDLLYYNNFSISDRLIFHTFEK